MGDRLNSTHGRELLYNYRLEDCPSGKGLDWKSKDKRNLAGVQIPYLPHEKQRLGDEWIRSTQDR